MRRTIERWIYTIRLNAQDANAHCNRGIAYKNLGQNERSNQDFDETIRLNPSLKQP